MTDSLADPSFNLEDFLKKQQHTENAASGKTNTSSDWRQLLAKRRADDWSANGWRNSKKTKTARQIGGYLIVMPKLVVESLYAHATGSVDPIRSPIEH